MKRKYHKLNAGKLQTRCKNIIYMDSESRVDKDTLQHKPYLICATFLRGSKRTEKDYINEGVYDFWLDVAKFAQKKQIVQVWAHNMGYDCVNTRAIPQLAKCGFRLVSFFEKGSTFIYKMKAVEKFTNEKGEIEEDKETIKTIFLLSSTNFYAQKLSEVGKVFGSEKINIKEEYNTDYNTISIEDSIIYCRQDVKIVEISMNALFDFVNRYGLGMLGKTAASQSFNAFRFKFMTENIYIHNNEKAIKLERAAYYGGRVECWHIGKLTGNYFYADVNSMYPYVMRNLQFPTKLLSYRGHCDIETIQEYIENGDGVIAKVKIKTDKPYFPKRIDKKLIFPIGEFYTFLSTYELKFAIEHNLITEVREASFYEMHNIFKEFIDFFYDKRMKAKKEKDKIHTYLFKLLMNCLYGKFGQLSEDWQRVGDAEINVVKEEQILDSNNKLHLLKTFGGTTFEKMDTDESFNSFPAIAAHVTGAARMHLLKHIICADWKNVVYMDTDSLFCNEKGYNNLNSNNLLDEYKLGKMKIENYGEELIINAPKDYFFNGKLEIMQKRKGISKDARGLTDKEYKDYLLDRKNKLTKKEYNEFIKTVKKEDLTVNIQWLKINSYIKEGQLKYFRNINRIKKLTRKYEKGIVLKNGVVKPFVLQE